MIASVPVAWTHDVGGVIACPGGGQISSGGCRHEVDLQALRARAEAVIAEYGPGNWDDEDDLIQRNLDLYPSDEASAVAAGRFVAATSPEVVIALVDALRVRRDEQEPVTCGTEVGFGFRAVDDLSVDVGAFLDRMSIARSDWIRVGKVAEEGGEVIGALIKHQDRRAPFTDVIDELGDVFLAALAAAYQLGLRPSEIIAERWKVVSQR